MQKEAKARIKINNLLQKAGWRFFDDEKGKANISLENNIKMKKNHFDDMGENFEKTKNGFVDFLLLDEKGFPFIVLEAKSEDKDPLVGKKQARDYAKHLHVKFIILSNGNIHYLWNIEKGNPQIITSFPTYESLKNSRAFNVDPNRLIDEAVSNNYVALTQYPRYEEDPRWLDEDERKRFIEEYKIKFLRDYQKNAVHSIQKAVKSGKNRFLFEMATGTGKTLTSAAVIKLFLRTGNASRVLFLVDRVELENQAKKSFTALLKNDYMTVIYKENRDDWKKAEIVVTTVQSLLFNNKYMRLFSPTDFDFVISDESHRSISGNSRAVFEYFIGYKLGLTATPKDYLKNVDAKKMNENDPRQWERRQLLDTYKIFGCESGMPTFRYSLIDGVKEKFLVNPTVVDARTEITTQLLSDEGYIITIQNDDGEEEEQTLFQRDFEKKFFSDETNKIFCKTFVENAKTDPISGEIGKTIVFCVRRSHATRITHILNEFAEQVYPGKYNSDFAEQITSDITDAQQSTINFANNNLNGHTNFLEDYKSSKTRVCVTVGMMTTGYDCEDILNIVLLRPIFSPTDFVQIKGRGTRKFTFEYKYFRNELGEQQKASIEKNNFKLFDFFANCEYFEEKFNYDEVIKLPPVGNGEGSGGGGGVEYEVTNMDLDPMKVIKETIIGDDCMKIDRKLYEQFEDTVREDEYARKQYEDGNVDVVLQYVQKNYFNKPNDYLNMEKLRASIGVDRRVSLHELLDKIFGRIDKFKSKNELLDEEFDKYLILNDIDGMDYNIVKSFFKAYITDGYFREIIDTKQFALLSTYSGIALEDVRKLGKKIQEISEYIKDNIRMINFAA